MTQSLELRPICTIGIASPDNMAMQAHILHTLRNWKHAVSVANDV